MTRPRLTVDGWREIVCGDRRVSNGVRAVLLYLSTRMRADLTVSVPRSTIAAVFGVSESEIRTRIQAARDANLLDVVRRGRPGVTAMYAAITPGRSTWEPPGSQAHGNLGVPMSTPSDGNPGVPSIYIRDSPSAGRRQPADTWSLRSPSPDGDGDGEQHQQQDRSSHSSSPRSGDGEPRSGDTVFDPSSGIGIVTDGTNEGADDSVERPPARRLVLDAIQRSAGEGGYCGDDVAVLLNGLEAGLGDWATIHWSLPSGAARDRRQAGRQLNMMRRTYQVTP